MKNLIYILFLFCSFSYGQKTMAELQTLFTAAENGAEGYNEALTRSNSDGSSQEYYYLNWTLEGYINAWQAVDSVAYFDKAKLLIDNTIAQSETITVNSIDFDGWNWDDVNDPIELWASMYMKEVATFLRIIDQSPTLKSANQAWFDTTLAFTENIWAWFKERGEDGNQYGYELDGTVHWARIAMELYLITGDTQYKTFLDNATHLGCACPETHKGNSFQDVLLFTTTNNLPTINIDNNWVAGVGVIDVSHAAAVVNFYLIAYEQGFEWATWEILNRFVNTFNELIYEGNPVQNRLNLDGTGALETTGLSIGAQNVLGRYNYEFEVFLEDDTADIGFNDMQRLGIMMKNKRILDDGKPLYPENYAPLKKKERTPARIIGL